MDPHPHPHLNCPRCDSTNTKFCYYNNYNLSQPRHFCKACKRYWTRGGTLRNVPVGGGCRKKNKSKNKIRVKCNDDVQITTQPIDLPTQAASDNLNIPHFSYTNYSNPNPYMDQLNFPFSTSGLGLGFSSGLMASHHEVQNDNELFKQIQNNVVIGNTNDSLLGYDYNQDQEMTRRGRNGKEVVKVEGTDHCRLNWNNQINLGQINSSNSSDSSSLLWTTNINNVGSWFHDPSNIGSSVSSLI